MAINVNDWVVGMLNGIGGGVNGGAADLLTKSPAQFNKTLYDASIKLSDVVAMPIAAAVLSIVLFIQFTTLSTKAEGDKQTMFKLICMTMIEACLILFFTNNATLIVQAISNIGDWAVQTAQSAMGVVKSGVGNEKLGDMMADPVKKAGIGGQAAAMIILLIPWLVSKVGYVIVTVVIYLRFIQLYLMMSFCPVPVTLLVNDHTRQMGIGYFKQFAEVTFQTVMLFLGLIFYRMISISTVKGGSYKKGDSLAGWCLDNFCGLLLASVLLIAIVALSNKAAKSIFGD